MSHSRRRALIILYYWPPAGGGGVQRWLKFAKYMPKQGWDPIVFAPEGADYPLLDPSLERQVSSEIEVVRYPIREVRKLYKKFTRQADSGSDADNLFYQDKSTLSPLKKLALFLRSNLFIPDARATWIRPAASFLKSWLVNNPVDAIISTGPPHSCHMIAYRLQQATGLPWVADFRDPWTDIEFFEQLSLTDSSRKKHFRLQEQVMSSADRVVTVSPSWAQLFRTYGALETKVITNGFDPADIKEDSSPPDTDRFVIAHVGTLELDRSPVTLWEGLQNLIRSAALGRRKLELRFSGKVDRGILATMPEYLRKYVVMPGYLTHDEALQEMQQANVLLLLQNLSSSNNVRGRIPGKVFEYISTGNPILMLGDTSSDLAEILSDFDAHGVFDMKDADGIQYYMEQLMHAPRNTAGADAEILNQFTRQYLTKELTDTLDHLIDSKD